MFAIPSGCWLAHLACFGFCRRCCPHHRTSGRPAPRQGGAAGACSRALAEYQQKGLAEAQIAEMEKQSPLGCVLAAGLRNAGSSREIMKEAIEEAGRGVSHQLERYLTTLGTIASISPLMGLFGTIVGMIEIFGAQSPSGRIRSNPRTASRSPSTTPDSGWSSPFRQ